MEAPTDKAELTEHGDTAPPEKKNQKKNPLKSHAVHMAYSALAAQPQLAMFELRLYYGPFKGMLY